MFLQSPKGIILPAQPPIQVYPEGVNPRTVNVGESTNPMVNINDKINVKNVYNDFDLTYRESLMLREEVLHKLLQAEANLPHGYSFTILDGYRNRIFQLELLTYYTNLYPELKEGYVSDPQDGNLVPPHTTGGAVDLTLAFEGQPLALGTDYDSFDEKAWIDALERESPESVENNLRRLMYKVLTAEGFAPYPLEWWHWSYGDQWWAAFYNKPSSLYPEHF